MPREVGALLLATGVIMGLLPPPPGPFDLTVMVTGGVALWPRGLRIVEGWTRRRFPRAYGAGMAFLGRYLDDLERRYPGSTHAAEVEGSIPIQTSDDLAGDNHAHGPDRHDVIAIRAVGNRNGEAARDEAGG